MLSFSLLHFSLSGYFYWEKYFVIFFRKPCDWLDEIHIDSANESRPFFYSSILDYCKVGKIKLYLLVLSSMNEFLFFFFFCYSLLLYLLNTCQRNLYFFKGFQKKKCLITSKNLQTLLCDWTKFYLEDWSLLSQLLL